MEINNNEVESSFLCLAWQCTLCMQAEKYEYLLIILFFCCMLSLVDGLLISNNYLYNLTQ